MYNVYVFVVVIKYFIDFVYEVPNNVCKYYVYYMKQTKYKHKTIIRDFSVI